MKVIVLGAGVIGTTTAWFLSKAGHEVEVIDRQPLAGYETSFANGGQISVSHAEPWANPSAPFKILKWLFKEDAPLLFRLRADAQQWAWALRFLRECLPSNTRDNINQIVNLGLFSRETLRELRRETGINYDQREAGILHFYTSSEEFEKAVEPTQIMRSLGCDRKLISADECVSIEPALTQARPKLVGATYTPSDESGDAHMFTQELSKLAAARGVRFHFRQEVKRIEYAGDSITGIHVVGKRGEATVKADAYVVAMGSYSTFALRPIGIRIPVYPAKGYSVTMTVKDPSRAHTVSLTDDEYKLVFSRLGDRLRIAGTCELNGYSTEINETRCQAIVRRVEELFPGGGDASKATFWAGLRPATPGNVPIIGRSRYRNLFLNTGHGTLGWTHSCGSGRALAALISGKAPEVDFRFATAAA